ncbi:MAG TPA: hypothetical protein V6C65_04655 [Allocoleopsis sp.]
MNALTKREIQLLAIVAKYMRELASKYPTAARSFEDMQAEIISLTVDWEDG